MLRSCCSSAGSSPILPHPRSSRGPAGRWSCSPRRTDASVGSWAVRSTSLDHWVLTVRFVSVDAYRRALSPFEVREHVIPLLSEALTDTPSTFETLLTARKARQWNTRASCPDDDARWARSSQSPWTLRGRLARVDSENVECAAAWQRGRSRRCPSPIVEHAGPCLDGVLASLLLHDRVGGRLRAAVAGGTSPRRRTHRPCGAPATRSRPGRPRCCPFGPRTAGPASADLLSAARRGCVTRQGFRCVRRRTRRRAVPRCCRGGCSTARRRRPARLDRRDGGAAQRRPSPPPARRADNGPGRRWFSPPT